MTYTQQVSMGQKRVPYFKNKNILVKGKTEQNLLVPRAVLLYPLPSLCKASHAVAMGGMVNGVDLERLLRLSKP